MIRFWLDSAFIEDKFDGQQFYDKVAATLPTALTNVVGFDVSTGPISEIRFFDTPPRASNHS